MKKACKRNVRLEGGGGGAVTEPLMMVLEACVVGGVGSSRVWGKEGVSVGLSNGVEHQKFCPRTHYPSIHLKRKPSRATRQIPGYNIADGNSVAMNPFSARSSGMQQLLAPADVFFVCLFCLIVLFWHQAYSHYLFGRMTGTSYVLLLSQGGWNGY